MKSKTTKGIAVLLACFLGMAAVGCSGDNDSSSKNSDAAEVSAATLPVETDEQGEAVTDASGNEVLASGATDFMVKEIEFTWGNQNGSSDSSQDATEATDSNGNAVTTAAGGSSNSATPANGNASASNGNTASNGNGNNASNGNSEVVTSYAAVTDDSGNKVVDDNGKVVTEVVTTPSSNGGAVVDPNQNTAAPYTEKLDTFQAYWMDMTKSQDIVFNGDMINVTFKVKDTAPDGNYVIHLSDSQYNSEFANWDAKALVPSVTNGCITVGDATPEAQTATNASDFVLTADSVTAKQGDEVTVSFNIADNPGMVAFVLRFQYDCNALEIVDAEVGDDCADALRNGLNH